MEMKNHDAFGMIFISNGAKTNTQTATKKKQNKNGWKDGEDEENEEPNKTQN